MSHVAAWVASILIVAAHVQQEGPTLLPVVAFPVAITALPLILGAERRLGFAIVGVPALLMVSFCLISIFSIGVYYFPSTALIIVGASLAIRGRRKT